MPVLKLQPLTIAHFAPFGDALIVSDQLPQRSINNGSSTRYDALTTVDVLNDKGAPCLCLFRSQGTDITQPLAVLERHQLGSQTFLPLSDVQMLVAVAKSDESGQAPDEQSLHVFITQPGEGVTIKAGIWHHPLMTLGAGDVMVLERKGPNVDCDIVVLNTKWHIEINQLLEHL